MKAHRVVSAVIMAVLCEFTDTAFPANAVDHATKSSNRVVIGFNTDWLFAPQDIVRGQAVSLNESSFEPICLPHANAIEKHLNIDTASFARITWYRKHFTPPTEYKGRRFLVEFQGVSKVAEVYVNGQTVGRHKGAYTPFTIDITDNVKTGGDNVIAVRVDSRQHKDIPPEGMNVDYMIFGGIVRDVTMTIVDPLHVDWVYVSRDSGNSNCIRAKTRVVNNGTLPKTCTVITSVADSFNTIVATAEDTQTIAAGSSYEFSCLTSPIANPRPWHPDHPYLYTVYTRLESGSFCVDEYRVKTGIRYVSFNKSDGLFYINGQPLKLRGLNRHESYPFIGRAAADRVQRKDADIIKFDFGCNIVRCSHYPQSPAFLDRCDEIGLLVLEEMPGWMYVSDRPDWQAIALQNVNDMIMRDRNHPSIISFGVRINESADFHGFYERTNHLARALDPGRPTHGVRVVDRGSAMEFLEDVWAYNFAVPSGTPRPMPWLTTESVGHRVPTHSWDDERRLISQMLAHAAVHDSAAANPKIAGLLGWCAFDYNSPYRYAEKKVNYQGVADIFRIPKFAAYFYKSQTDPSLYGPMVFIAHYWRKALTPDDVWVASNCEKVELFVNNVSKGKRSPDRYPSLSHPLFVWKSIPFKAGELKAVGYIGGTVAATIIRKTPGIPVRLAMAPDDTVLEEGGDMTRVVVTAVDSNGQVVPQTSEIVVLSVSGAGDFLGESPITLEDGKTAFFVKTRAHRTGNITCRAVGNNLTEANTCISVQAATQKTGQN
ncbi:MAG: glycoside hydrolase family 2 TIM barrel-domain containing protein [Chitinispirillaceae bacterium]|jgi:beta-galactosidase